ncbi:hypothetical protein [Dyadobacter frigoris]|uniref:M28 family peptidase n=1 Tax=Dyadobacter frigoris TaxID=2576211 RepID=A0A4U6CZT4_9BACT|nr:hypothetical protein [Dyadobacter frigoris]TKT88918.1 hypothetical protein FDK13_25130 [Dyadobacter frigoris]
MKRFATNDLAIFLLLTFYSYHSPAQQAGQEIFQGADLYADVVRYVNFGIHRTGTEGDNKTSEWIKEILGKNGFKTEYVTFPVEQFFPEKTQLKIGKRSIEIFPVWPVLNAGVNITSQLVEANKDARDFSGKIVWINQQSKERSFSFMDEENAAEIKKIIDAGAKAIILVADNAAGEIAAINTLPGVSYPIPVVQVAPKDIANLTTHGFATLTITGKLKKVTARNIQGTFGSGDKTIIISTPISGWFTCGGERGPGIATFNALAKWVAEKKLPYKFIFTGNSGHELAQHQGTHIFLHEKAPKPADVRLWVHLGASFATYSYTKSDKGLVRQAIADNKRIVYFAGNVGNSVNQAFGSIAIQQVKDKAYGELVVAQKQGYSPFIGFVGTSSFPLFHTKLDDASTTSPALLEEMANAIKQVIETELGKDKI